MADPQIIWFRQDLRLADQAAVRAAATAGPVVAVYVLDDETPGEWRLGGAQRWWLHHSLIALVAALERHGVPLVLRRGRPEAVLSELAAALQTRSVHALHHYEPFAKAQEAAVAERLDLADARRQSAAAAGHGPSPAAAGASRYFTPFWKAAQAQLPPAPPLPAPKLTAATAHKLRKRPACRLAPAADEARTGRAGSTCGSPARLGAQAQSASQFAQGCTRLCRPGRNIPGEALTSRLSPHLHFGEISPETVWATISSAAGAAAEPFLRELGWRDFAQTLLDSFPESATTHQRTEFDRFAFTDVTTLDGSEALEAWRHGHTGYPIVDAGMRQLWATGWMHNRVRMLAASFLIKHLRIDWREGSRWFWDTLVDADLGSNTLGWQWSMGSGVDSQPFYRIMAPVTQSEKFDPTGSYICRWVPELADVPSSAIHAPWLHGGVRGYPGPIVDHSVARGRALAAYAASRA